MAAAVHKQHKTGGSSMVTGHYEVLHGGMDQPPATIIFLHGFTNVRQPFHLLHTLLTAPNHYRI